MIGSNSWRPSSSRNRREGSPLGVDQSPRMVAVSGSSWITPLLTPPRKSMITERVTGAIDNAKMVMGERQQEETKMCKRRNTFL